MSAALQNYGDFLQSKRLDVANRGFEIDPATIHPLLFPHQRDIVRWAVRKGRAAIFADTGLGKTFIQIEYARAILREHDRVSYYAAGPSKVLIIAPLAVARQTQKEGYRLGISIEIVRKPSDCMKGINITNYEMAGKFDPADFIAVILDESSVLKSLDSLTRLALTRQWRNTPYRLCCTATPAPNDLKEIVNHSAFLGIMSRREVFASFFINETGKKSNLKVRLKKHAVKPFYRWLAGWAMAVKKPSDIGDYSDDGYVLPPLNVVAHTVKTDYRPEGQLFFTEIGGVTERAKVQRATIQERAERAAELVNANLTEDVAVVGKMQWIIWHHLNDEGYALQKLIPDSVLVEGSQSADDKAQRLIDFVDGKYRVLITKPSIAGFGMNFQNAAKQIFCGISDSFEEYYQAIRRSWRYGQTRPVDIHIIYADVQEEVYENIQRKQKQASELTDQLIAQMRDFEREELSGRQQSENYRTAEAASPRWRMLLGDSTERLKEIASESVGLGIHSPPFVNRYTYTATERDLGNSRDMHEFIMHYRYIIQELYRVTMPGRVQIVHVQQVRVTKRDTGNVGMMDFRGAVIKAFTREGFIYASERTIDKDAQIQARRKKHVGLKFATLDSDQSKLDGALADYLLIFRKPGASEPIKGDVTREEWIKWARPVWYDINEIDVLPSQKARASEDEAHLCPLQLEVIERCVRLWSNRGDVVFSPFAGVGSEPYVAVRLGRVGVGIELKPEWYKTAISNLQEAENRLNMPSLFDLLPAEQDQDQAMMPEAEAEVTE